MTKIDKRIEKNSNSILNLKNLLIEVCKEPSSFKNDELLKKALKSQGGLSKYENSDLNIIKSSINTFKRVSPLLFDNGFDDIDKLRIKAFESINESIESENSSNKQTKVGLSKKVSELEKRIDTLQRNEFVLLQAIQGAIKDIKSIGNNENTSDVKALSERAVKKLVSIINSNDNLHMDNNVIELFNRGEND